MDGRGGRGRRVGRVEWMGGVKSGKGGRGVRVCVWVPRGLCVCVCVCVGTELDARDFVVFSLWGLCVCVCVFTRRS